jgi:hypothetical protein
MLLVEHAVRFIRNAQDFGKRQWIHGALLLAIFGWCVWAILHILLAPPATFDSLSYHLPMIASWLQRGEICSYETTTLRQIISPFNTEILQMFHIIFLRRDVIVDAVQLECLVISIVGVYVMGRDMGLTRGWALNAAAIFLTAPLVLMESYTTQNDLAVVAALVLSLQWLSSYITTTRPVYLVLLSMSLGILLGTKFHMLVGVPVLLIVILFTFLMLRARGFRWSHVAVFVSSLVMSIGAMGAGVYIRNVRDFGAVIPPLSAIDRTFVVGWSTLLANISYFGQWWLTRSWDFSSDATWTQDTGNFSPFFGYIVLPLSFFGFVFAVFRLCQKNNGRFAELIPLTMFATAAGIFLGFSLSHQPRPFDLRYLLFMPFLLGGVAVWALQTQWPTGDRIFGVVAGLAGILLALATGLSHNYPRIQSVINLDPGFRSASYLRGHGVHSPLYQIFDDLARPGETVLFSGIEDDWSYPLFGNDLSRRVYYAKSFDSFVSLLSTLPVGWVVIRETKEYDSILKFIRDRPFRFQLLDISKDTTGNYFMTNLLLFRVRHGEWNPTWQRGIYGDRVSSGEVVLGSYVPGTFVFTCVVDSLFKDTLALQLSNLGSADSVIHFPRSGRYVLELPLKHPGELRCIFNATYVPRALGRNDDIRQLSVVVPSVEFTYNRELATMSTVQVFP